MPKELIATNDPQAAAETAAPASTATTEPSATAETIAAAPAELEVRYDALDKVIEVAQQSPGAADYLMQKLIGPKLAEIKLQQAQTNAMLEFNISPAEWEVNKVLLDGDTPESTRLKAQHYAAFKARTSGAAGQASAPGADTAPSPSGAAADAAPPADDTSAEATPNADTAVPALPAAAVIPPARAEGELTLQERYARAEQVALQEWDGTGGP